MLEMQVEWALYPAEALVLWAVWIMVYRRFFHPLVRIPGPFLPAVTRMYIWYWNVPQDGHFYRKIDELHARYGPVVRIAPNEIHLSDPDNYDKVYSVGGNFYKDPVFYSTLGVAAMFTAISNDEHRRRRAPLNHFFSRRAVLELEDIVQEKAGKLCHRMQNCLSAGSPVDLRSGLRAVSIDVITEYAFADCWAHLDAPDFNSWFSEAVRDTTVMWWSFQQFPILLKPMQAIPENLARKMSSAMDGWLDCIVRTREYVAKVQKSFAAGIKPKRRTIFHELLDPTADDKVPPIPPTLEALSAEALSFCTAAADTTGNAMEMSVYHVITNRLIYEALTKELRQAFPNPNAELDYATLEKLPYLTGVVREGQRYAYEIVEGLFTGFAYSGRLSYGVISRLPRVTPEGGAVFNGYFVPSGTVVSMSSWMMHRDPDAFPLPDIFDPMRWMDPATVRTREKCLVSFSRGSRSCIGQNLAMCELYVTIGTLFRRFEKLKPVDIGPKDMTYVDYFTAFHPKDSRSCRVVSEDLGIEVLGNGT